IADEAGRIALIFPYPAPRSFAVNSPPTSPANSPTTTGKRLTDEEWPIRLQASYTPFRPASSPPDPLATKPQLPDLKFTLAQPPATLWADAARTQPLL